MVESTTLDKVRQVLEDSELSGVTEEVIGYLRFVEGSDQRLDALAGRPMLLDTAIYEKTNDPAAATLDYVGGRADLAAQILRAIGDPALRFAEDKLRMLRAVRFAARLDLAIEPGTMAAIRNAAAQID